MNGFLHLGHAQAKDPGTTPGASNTSLAGGRSRAQQTQRPSSSRNAWRASHAIDVQNPPNGFDIFRQKSADSDSHSLCSRSSPAERIKRASGLLLPAGTSWR